MPVIPFPGALHVQDVQHNDDTFIDQGPIQKTMDQVRCYLNDREEAVLTRDELIYAMEYFGTCLMHNHGLDVTVSVNELADWERRFAD